MPQPMKPILSSLGGTWLITFSSDVFDSPVVVVVLAMVVTVLAVAPLTGPYVSSVLLFELLAGDDVRL